MSAEAEQKFQNDERFYESLKNVIEITAVMHRALSEIARCADQKTSRLAKQTLNEVYEIGLEGEKENG